MGKQKRRAAAKRRNERNTNKAQRAQNQKFQQKQATKTQNAHEEEQQKEISDIIRNGLSDVLFSGEGGTQLSETDTLFKNNRWYLISNMRQLLSQIYVEHGLIKTVVDVPVDDGFSKGFEIKTSQLDPEEITDLQRVMKRKGDTKTAAQAMKWNRLFGGAGILVMTNQKHYQEFDIGSIKEGDILDFKPVDMWELYGHQQNISEADDLDVVDKLKKKDHKYDYYGVKVHESRVMTLKGLEAPSFLRPRLRGWGLSVVEALVRSINQYLKANTLSFELLDEFKVDVYKIKGLANTLLNPGGEAKARERIALANSEKNYKNAITMDAEDEYEQKKVQFQGMADVMMGIRLQIASDLRMPLTKVFGQSATGFNAGEEDIENYNQMVESEVRSKAKPHVIKMVKLRCQQRYGFVPSDLDIEFPSLRVLSSDQQETVKTQQFNRLIQAVQSGAISGDQFIEACNKAELFPIDMDKPEGDIITPDQGQPGGVDVE